MKEIHFVGSLVELVSNYGHKQCIEVKHLKLFTSETGRLLEVIPVQAGISFPNRNFDV
jgi:hypothetical protein